MPAFMNLAFSWIIVTTLLAVGQAQADHFDMIARQANVEENIDAIVKATMAGGGNPIEQASSGTGAGSSPGSEDGDGIAFTGPRSAVEKPSEFAGRYLYGPADAAVQIVMLSDYQCPDCKRYEDQVWKILQARDDVSLSVRHFPFNEDCNPYVPKTLHANACWAARFAETAGVLGGPDSFWKAHRMLFARKGRFTDQDFPGMVVELGFQPQMFQQIMMGQAVDALVSEDIELGGTLGVFYTPMVFINGVELKWYQIPTNLAATVDALARAIAAGQNDGRLKAPPTTAVKYVEDWRDGPVRQIPDSLGVSKGIQSAPHSIDLFVDYTDPTTKSLHDRVETLREKYPNIRYNMFSFPKNPDCNPNIPDKFREAYPSGCVAARAVKAAAKIGGREAHWAMIEFLMASGTHVTTPEILAESARLGLDPDDFMIMMNSKEVDALIQTDVLRGKGWGLRSIPSIFVDGKHIPRWQLEDEPIVERVVKIAVTGKE